MPASTSGSRVWVTSAAGLALVTACSVAVTLLVALDSNIHFAYGFASAKEMLQAAVFLVSSLAGLLVYGRFTQSRQLGDLLLVSALGLIATCAAAFGVPGALLRTNQAFAWSAMTGSALAGVLFCLSAWTPTRSLGAKSRLPLAAAIGVPAATGGLFLVFWLLRDALPVGLNPATFDDSGGPYLAHPMIVTIQTVGAVAYFLAAAGFLRRARITGDELSGWFAIGSVLGGFTRLNYLLFPVFVYRWLFIGDVFRLAAIVAFVVGSGREISTYWRRLADAAVAEERRRIARDLHDRLAQEIAFIGRNARLLGNDATGQRIARAAERAYTESRRVIETLRTDVDEPLDLAVNKEVTLAARRYGTQLELDLESGIDVGSDRREALLRISAEAVSNAARHSGAPRVRVELQRTHAGVQLRVHDQGMGFCPAADGNGGFGLVSMREYAQAVGAELHVRSAPGAGTEIEVVV